MEKLLSKFQKYYRRHRDKRLKESKDNYHKNKEKILARDRKRYNDNIDYYREKKLTKEISYIESWLTLVPLHTKCQICGKRISLISNSKSNSIHFDHRHGGKEPIKGRPSNWLRSHVKSKKNEVQWVKSDFGYLCCKCNMYLSTKNRKQVVFNMIRYVFGSSILEKFHDIFGEYKRNSKKI